MEVFLGDMFGSIDFDKRFFLLKAFSFVIVTYIFDRVFAGYSIRKNLKIFSRCPSLNPCLHEKPKRVKRKLRNGA
jgi:hypothetical protein